MRRIEIQKAVKDKQWQALRMRLKGLPLQDKVKRLITYNDGSRKKGIQIKNYLNALRRSGQIK